MDFIGISIKKGPSLLSSSSCVCASLHIPDTEQELLVRDEQQASSYVENIARKLGWDTPVIVARADNDPLLIGLVVWFAERLLETVSSRYDNVQITRDQTEQLFHIALPEYNRPLDRAVLQYALSWAVSVFPRHVCHGVSGQIFNHDPESMFNKFLETHRRLKKVSFIRNIVSTAVRQGFPWLPLDRYSASKNKIQIGFGRFQRILDGSTTFESSYEGVRVSLSKHRSRDFLADLGFPVTRQVIVSNPEEAKRAAELLGYPVVLKTEFGTHGDGVICGLATVDAVLRAFEELKSVLVKRRGQGTILVEKFVPGNDYRITVVKGKLHNVFRRIPPRVIGDGGHSISELVEIENRSPLRGDKSSEKSVSVYLQLGAPELSTLANQGLTPESVPAAGEEVNLRFNANWSSGGTVEGCDLVHPDNIALTERVAEALRIDILGIDIITPDLGKSFLDGALTILEVNHSPGISGYFDDEGAYIDTAMRAVELLNPLLEEEYVPVVAVQEHSMSAAVTSAIGSVLDAAGYCPGVVNKSGMQVGGSPWAAPDSLDYRDPAFTVLRNSRIDAAVIERSSQQILDYGLGSGGCDISVVLDSSSDSIVTDLWPTGVKLSEATKLLITNCRRACVAFVDDPLIDLAAENIPAAKLYAMSLKGWTDAIEKHVASGATALALENVSETGFSVRISRADTEAATETVDIAMPMPERSASGLMICLTALTVLVSMGYTTEEATRFLIAVA